MFFFFLEEEEELHIYFEMSHSSSDPAIFLKRVHANNNRLRVHFSSLNNNVEVKTF